MRNGEEEDGEGAENGEEEEGKREEEEGRTGKEQGEEGERGISTFRAIFIPFTILPARER